MAALAAASLFAGAGLASLAAGSATATAAAPATYFVSPAGTDTVTASCGLNSSTNAFPTIEDALGCAGPGDTIVLAPTGSTPYPGFGTVSGDVTIEAAPGQGARGVEVALGVPAPGSAGTPGLVVDPGAVVQVTGVTLSGSAPVPSGLSQQASVLNFGNLTLTGDTVTGSVTGPGIENETTGATSATLAVLDSTVSDNTAAGGIESVAGTAATGSLAVTIANSTVDGNFDGAGAGGVFAIAATGTTSTVGILNSTITGNEGAATGGIDATGASILTLSNTVVAGNTDLAGVASTADCNSGPAGIVDGPGGHNLVGSSHCGALVDAVDGDQLDVSNPGLGALADNGGPTDTVALDAGSPAIGAASAATCEAAPVANLDQRGDPRNAVARGACDIGAFDTGGSPVAPAAAPLVVVTSDLPDATAGAAYAPPPLVGGGGSGPYSWALVRAPSWLSLGAGSGQLSGTPPLAPVAGEILVEVELTDSASPPTSTTRSYVLGIVAPGTCTVTIGVNRPTVTFATEGTLTVGVAGAPACTGTTYTFSVTPPGGTPTLLASGPLTSASYVAPAGTAFTRVGVYRFSASLLEASGAIVVSNTANVLIY